MPRKYATVLSAATVVASLAAAAPAAADPSEKASPVGRVSEALAQDQRRDDASQTINAIRKAGGDKDQFTPGGLISSGTCPPSICQVAP